MKIPNTLYEVQINAGKSEIINVSGKYLRIIESPDNFEMQINEVGAAFPVYGSFYLRTEEEMARLLIRNNGVNSGKIRFFVAADEVGDNVLSSFAVSGNVKTVPSLKITAIKQWTPTTSGSWPFSNYPTMKAFLAQNTGTKEISFGTDATARIYIRPNETFYAEIPSMAGWNFFQPAGSEYTIAIFSEA